MHKFTLSSMILALGLAACGSPAPEEAAEETATDAATPAATPMQAIATLQTAEGDTAGSATATGDGGLVTISLSAESLPPGEHWNPTNQRHGLEGEPGQHAGDMPNLTVAADGTGTLEYSLVGGTFEGLLDADGSAFVVHAMPDDQTTDPSGNSGDRIACGVFNAS